MMCAMFLSVFTACTVKSKDEDAETSIAGRTIKLTVWGAAEDQDLLKEIIEDFKNENPHLNLLKRSLVRIKLKKR